MRKLLFVLMAALVFTSCGKDENEPEVSYTVTFNADGGTPTPQSQTVKAGETATAPTSPTKQNYVFLFWYLNSSTTAYNFATPVRSDITLQAKWEDAAVAQYWQVSWELDGGVWPATGDNHATQVVKGGTLAESTAPTKTGKVFDGWYKETTLTNKINFPYSVNAVTANFTLYAKWSNPAAEYWNITWELNGGAWPSTGDNHVDKIEKGTTLAEPVAPTKSGSTFDGWYKEATFTNKVTFPATVTGDFKLYAKWSAGVVAELFLNIGEEYPILTGHIFDFESIASSDEVKPIVVTTNQPSWNAVSNQMWCTVTKEVNQFTIKVSANTASTERTATVTVSAGSAANIVLQVKQKGAVSEDPKLLNKAGYCLAYTMQIREAYLNGLRPSSITNGQGNTVLSVYYEPNNTIDYINFGYLAPVTSTTITEFVSSIPTAICGVSSNNDTEGAASKMNAGTYDFAGDPAKIVAYVDSPNGYNRLMSSLDNMKRITNNDGITQNLFSTISGRIMNLSNPYKMVVYGRDNSGKLIGKYIGYSTTGKSFTYWSIDTDNPSFGNESTIAIP